MPATKVPAVVPGSGVPTTVVMMASTRRITVVVVSRVMRYAAYVRQADITTEATPLNAEDAPQG